jgi:hypothetical protein
MQVENISSNPLWVTFFISAILSSTLVYIILSIDDGFMSRVDSFLLADCGFVEIQPSYLIIGVILKCACFCCITCLSSALHLIDTTSINSKLVKIKNLLMFSSFLAFLLVNCGFVQIQPNYLIILKNIWFCMIYFFNLMGTTTKEVSSLDLFTLALSFIIVMMYTSIVAMTKFPFYFNDDEASSRECDSFVCVQLTQLDSNIQLALRQYLGFANIGNDIWVFINIRILIEVFFNICNSMGSWALSWFLWYNGAT